MTNDLSNWFVVQTKPRQEKTANLNLIRQGYETYCPDVVVKKRMKDKWVEVVEPLFPRYLFLRSDPTLRDMSPIRSTLGVSTLVRFGETPAIVPDEVISFLRNSENPETKHHVSGESLFQTHEAVDIVSGPFAGLPGIYQMPKGEERAIVLITVLGRQNKILLHQDDLAKQ